MLVPAIDISYDKPHAFFYISVPNKGKGLAFFDIVDKFSNFRKK